MTLIHAWKAKGLWALSMLGLLALLAPPIRLTGGAIARCGLGALAVAALAFWLKRQRGATACSAPPRLSLVGRIGLTNRCGVALLQVDGESLVVAYGEGFASFQRTSRGAP
jgi:hypothetical protein